MKVISHCHQILSWAKNKRQYIWNSQIKICIDNAILTDSDNLIWFWAHQFFSLVINAACLAEKYQMPIYSFYLDPTVSIALSMQILIWEFQIYCLLFLAQLNIWWQWLMTFREKNWCAQNQIKLSEWSDMSTLGLLLKRAITMKIKLSVLISCKSGTIIISS
jgi:hypothetical protein